jgi:serine/threonine protein kinase/tetratricopeptide (TPR) repeat protein
VNDLRWERAKEVFGGALTRSPEERAAFVAGACAGDLGLATEVAALLRAHEAAGEFIDIPALQGGLRIEADEADDALLGTALGPYRVLELVGRGGMGTVYRGVRSDEHFEKQVALKVVRRGLDTDSILRRFKSERRILARLDHPGIARVLDGGTTPDGRPFLVMEYVVGERIDRYAVAHGLTIAERLNLFREVCAAVQYAHQNLVVHRDIKPANILVTSEGRPKLLDFGIAKLLDPDASDEPTATDARVLTPEYASPEQVRGEAVTTASDVYSLGVLLFELLTGQKPYRLESRVPHAVAQAVCEEEPPRPSTVALHELTHPKGSSARLRRALAGDLDTIVLMALRKEASRRYASVEQLSDDLRRHLDGHPVRAQRDTLRYRGAKFLKRNRLVVGGVAALSVTLVGGIGATSWQARVARLERSRAERRFSDVRRLAGTLIFQIQDAVKDIPGSTQAQKLLVTQALEYLDGLARDAAGDPGLQGELALAYARLGSVQGGGSANLGDTAGAQASYQKAIDLLGPLVATAPADAALQAALVGCHADLGIMLWYEKHDAREALVHLRTAATMAERAAVLAPADPRFQLQRLQISSKMGDVQIRNGDMPGAIESYRTSVERGELAAARWPGDVRIRAALIQSQGTLADCLRAVRNLPDALEFYRKARANAEALVDAQPTSVSYRSILAGILANTASLLVRMDRGEDAVASAEKAVAISTGLATADPSNERAQRHLVASENQLCEAFAHTPEPSRALPGCQAAVARARSILSSHPDSPRAQSDLADASLRLSEALHRLGDSAGALMAARAGLVAAQAAARSSPEGVESRLWVAALQSAVGDALGDRHLDASLAAYKDAATIREAAIAQDPRDMETREDLLRLYLAMGRLYARRVAVAPLKARRQEWQSARAVNEKAAELLAEFKRIGALPPSLSGEEQRLRREIAHGDAAHVP